MIFSGKYEVTEKVGQGGMGIVYRVRHLELETDLALKILPRHLSQDADLVERFRREARMMARLDHRNIVRVFDFVRDGDNYYLIMEFLQGRNLHQILQATLKTQGRPLLLPEVVRVGIQIADALAYAHARTPAVVHRDIKPSNIIIEDGTGRAVVTDFGIAKHLGQAQSDLTRSGLFVGTPKYCAPEQLRHDDDLDSRVDLYSLGMVLYEIYTGKQFFAGLKDHEVIGRVLYEKVEPTVVFPEAPPEFARLVLRAIALDRDERYATAELLAADLHACLRLLGGGETGGDGVLPAPGPRPDDEDIEGQIRVLERKRHERVARQAQRDCRKARAAAEERGTRAEAAAEYAAAAAREAEAEALVAAEQYEPAGSLFTEAAGLFAAAATEAERRRTERRIDEARAAMAATRSAAAAAEAATLASEPWTEAEGLARAAEESLARGEHERAIAQFGEAVEAFGRALERATRAHELRAVAAELPTVAAARAAAERAEAPALAADAFAEAVRTERELDDAIAAEHVTVAQALLVRARERFVAAEAAATEGRARRAAEAARSRMATAREAARGAEIARAAATELATAGERARAATGCERASEWEDARRLYDEAAELYEQAQQVARATAEERRAREALSEARAAMEGAREKAAAAQAADDAPTLYGRARELAEAAGLAAERGDVAAAVTEYRRAADQYAHAMQVAERRTQRRGVDRLLDEVAAARARAEEAGAAGGEPFAAAEQAEASARSALAADDLATSAVKAKLAASAYAEAATSAALARALAEADAALARAAEARARAVEAGAERAATKELERGDRLAGEAQTRRREHDAPDALRLATEAEARYDAALSATVQAAGAAVAAAKAAATAAGATARELAPGEEQERTAAAHVRANASVAAAAAYGAAGEAYRVARAAAEHRAERAAVEASLGELVRVRDEAAAAGASAIASFRAAEAHEAEARRALAADDGNAAERSVAAARAGYTEAHAAVDLDRQLARADEALARASARRDEALGVAANRDAPNEFATAERLHTDARQHRERRDADQALRLAEEATAAFGASLERATQAASGDVAGARAATNLVGASREELAEAQQLEESAAARLAAGELAAAIEGLRRAAGAYRAITERTSTAAHEARTAALAARAAAERVEATRWAARDFAAAVEMLEKAEAAFTGHRFGDAVREFAASARGFGTATDEATRARARASADARRAEAVAARGASEAAADVRELTGELARARRAFDDAEAAAARDDFVAAEAGYRAATEAFTALRSAAERAALAREARGAEERARALRATREAAGGGLGARWRLARADRALARGARAAATDDHAAARAEYLRAAALLEALPVAAIGSDLTSAGTIVRPLPAGSRRSVWFAAAGAASIAVVTFWAVGPAVLRRTGNERAPAREDRPAGRDEGAERPRDRPSPASHPAEGAGTQVARDDTTRQLPGEETARTRAVPSPAAVAPTVVAALPPPAPPTIAHAEPTATLVTAEEGKPASFRIDLADANGASYRWTVGGQVVADAHAPAFTVAPGDQPKHILVEAKTAGGVVTHSWDLAALQPAPPPVIPVMITERVPRESTLEVPLGAPKRFSVSAKGGERLAYAWSLDGKRIGSDAPTWSFTPQDDDEGKGHRVRVEVANGAKQVASADWSVTVPAAPIETRKIPQQDPTVTIGGEAQLAVDARVRTRDAVPLSYRWSVDRAPIRDATGPRLAYRVDRPRADVEVTVEAPGRVAAVERWRIRGEAPPTPRVEPPRVEPPRVEPPREAGASPQRELEAWIEAYRAAYQEKNVDRLVALGIVPADQRTKMAKILDDLDGLQVRIASHSVDVQGDDAATITMTRVDSFVAGGSRTEKVIPIKKTLRKRNGAWIAQ